MTPEAQRIAISEACGWTQHEAREATYWKFNGDFIGAGPPDYLNDLNAMHEAESLLTLDQMNRYTKELFKVMYVMPHDVGTAFLFIATATQRAEAFLKTLGLWKDDASNLNTVASDTVTN